MDPRTTDPRAWALAPHLVLLGRSADSVEWLNSETGTTCRLEREGDFVVLRRVGDRVVPVVAGQLLSDEAAAFFDDPEAVGARRAAAHAIVAVDVGVRS